MTTEVLPSLMGRPVLGQRSVVAMRYRTAFTLRLIPSTNYWYMQERVFFTTTQGTGQLLLVVRGSLQSRYSSVQPLIGYMLPKRVEVPCIAPRTELHGQP